MAAIVIINDIKLIVLCLKFLAVFPLNFLPEQDIRVNLNKSKNGGHFLYMYMCAGTLLYVHVFSLHVITNISFPVLYF